MCYKHFHAERFHWEYLSDSLQASRSTEDAFDFTHMASAFLRGLRQKPVGIAFHAMT